MKVFVLESEDLSRLGGPMGTERTTVNFMRIFKSPASAMAYAQKDYGKRSIRWKKHPKRQEWSSGDLLHVMYTIYETEVME